MDHQPYETWLYQRESLPPAEQLRLNEHLQSCEQCRQLAAGWSQVEALFQRVPPAIPTPGFAARWQQRLHEEQRMQAMYRQQRKLSWLALAFSLGAAGFMFVLMVLQFLLASGSPLAALVSSMELAAGILRSVQLAEEVLFNLSTVIGSALPLPYLLAGLAMFLGMFMLWILSLRHLLLPRRVQA